VVHIAQQKNVLSVQYVLQDRTALKNLLSLFLVLQVLSVKKTKVNVNYVQQVFIAVRVRQFLLNVLQVLIVLWAKVFVRRAQLAIIVQNNRSPDFMPRWILQCVRTRSMLILLSGILLYRRISISKFL